MISSASALKSVLLSLFLSALLWQPASAQEVRPGESLEVIVDALNVRPAPPRFGFSTVFTFKYIVEEPIAVLRSGAKIKALQTVFVGREQQWVRIQNDNSDGVVDGWIYVGRFPSLANVRVISSGSVSRSANGVSRPEKIDLLSFILPSAHAQESPVSRTRAVESDNRASTPQVLAFQIICVLVFVTSFVVFYKTTNDKWLTSLGALSILLIFGFISQPVFQELAQLGAK